MLLFSIFWYFLLAPELRGSGQKQNIGLGSLKITYTISSERWDEIKKRLDEIR